MTVRAVGWLMLCAGLLGGLSACSKESMLRSSLEEPEERKDTLELTLKVFDEHPEYVDELFALAREHPMAFQRLLENTATELEGPEFAAEVAGHLANHPKAVESTMMAMLAEARTRPELRAAIARAILANPDVMGQLMAEHPQITQMAIMRGLTVPAPVPAPAPGGP